LKAKDAVEKIPGILKANVVKKDAEAIKEQLAKVGCKVNLK
jgi:ribosomal protein L7/L12